MDDTGRIVSKQSGSHKPLTVESGIAAMRTILRQAGGIVRLIGVSGLGKTRLVQALFDNRVGTDALSSAIVAYTDQSHEPDPTARDMLHRFGVSGVRTIVVVDNCNPAMHRVLAQIVAEYATTLSLITVEYDVADDEPEETKVFQLEPASEKILVDILKRLEYDRDIGRFVRGHISLLSSLPAICAGDAWRSTLRFSSGPRNGPSAATGCQAAERDARFDYRTQGVSRS